MPATASMPSFSESLSSSSTARGGAVGAIRKLVLPACVRSATRKAASPHCVDRNAPSSRVRADRRVESFDRSFDVVVAVAIVVDIALLVSERPIDCICDREPVLARSDAEAAAPIAAAPASDPVARTGSPRRLGAGSKVAPVLSDLTIALTSPRSHPRCSQARFTSPLRSSVAIPLVLSPPSSPARASISPSPSSLAVVASHSISSSIA